MRNPWRHPFGVPASRRPRAEGQFHLPDGRHLGYAEYGDAFGPIVLWFHGTPGGRRQVPLRARLVAERMGLRVVAVERPGAGLSDQHTYRSIADWAADMVVVADALGADRIGVVGMSGGGPYALACAAEPALAQRVAAVGVLGSPTPSVGPDATAAGIIDFAQRVEPLVSRLRGPLAWATSALLTPVMPFGHVGYHALIEVMPEAGRQVLARPEVEAMFVDDIVHSARGGYRGLFDDARLFGRDWGFRLADVDAPVRWWHGEIEPFVALASARATVARLPDAELVVLHDETHIGGFSKADEILDFMHTALSPTSGPGG